MAQHTRTVGKNFSHKRWIVSGQPSDVTWIERHLSHAASPIRLGSLQISCIKNDLIIYGNCCLKWMKFIYPWGQYLLSTFITPGTLMEQSLMPLGWWTRCLTHVPVWLHSSENFPCNGQRGTGGRKKHHWSRRSWRYLEEIVQNLWLSVTQDNLVWLKTLSFQRTHFGFVLIFLYFIFLLNFIGFSIFLLFLFFCLF